MIGHGEVLLYFIELLRPDVGRHIVLTVGNPGLQRLVQLPEGDDLRDGAKLARHRVKHLGALDAHFHAPEVFRPDQRLVGRIDVGAVVPVGDRQHALGFELLVEVGHHRARHHLARPRIVAHQEGEIEDVEFPHPERAELGDRRRKELHRAELQRFKLLLVLVERGVRIDLNLDLAVGVFLGEILKYHRRLALRRVGRHHVAELYDDRLLGEGRAGEHEARCREGDRRKKKLVAHVSSGFIGLLAISPGDQAGVELILQPFPTAI